MGGKAADTNTEPTMSGAPRAKKRISFSIRGVTITDHPKNRPELVGTLVPWERVQFPGGELRLFDERWTLIPRSKLDQSWGFYVGRRGRAINRAKSRADRLMLQRAGFRVPIRTALPRWQAFGVLSLALLIGLLAVAGLVTLILRGAKPPIDDPLPLQIATYVAGFGFLVTLAAPVFALAAIHWRTLRHGVRSGTVSPWRVDAELFNGRAISIPFERVVRVSDWGGRWTIRDDMGRVICFTPPVRSHPALARLMEVVEQRGPRLATSDLSCSAILLPSMALALLALAWGLWASQYLSLATTLAVTGVTLAATTVSLFHARSVRRTLRNEIARLPVPWRAAPA